MSASSLTSKTPSMDPLTRIYETGVSFAEMVAATTQNTELFRIGRAHAAAPPEYAARIAATGRSWHLLSVSEDWCGDSVNTLHWVDALADSAPSLEHRIIGRDANPELMDRHLTNGRSRSIPIVILLDDQLVERAWWGPRPRALQEWFESAEAQAMTKDDRYKVLRTRYARDRGRAIMDELTTMIEGAAQAMDADEASTTAHAVA